MKATLDRKTLESMRNGFKDGAGAAWEQAREQARRVEFRTPWTYRKPLSATLGAKPWLVGVLVFSAVLTALAAVLYFRKRKQVADHYNMDAGGNEAIPAGGARQDDSLAPSTRYAVS